MRVLLRLSSWIDTVTEQIGQLARWLVILTIMIGVFNVVARQLGYILKKPLASNSYIESQWYLFSLVFFLAFAYVLRHNGHVRVDFLYASWSPRRKALVNLVGTLLFLLPFCAVVLYVAYPQVLFSWQILEASSDAGGLPRYPIKTMIIVAFVLLILQATSEIIKNIAILRGHQELAQAQQFEETHVAPE